MKLNMKFVVVYIFLIILFVVTLFPIFCVIMSSLKDNFDILANSESILPKKIVFNNYVEAWKIADFQTYTFNSMYMSMLIVIGTLMLSSMGGYVFARSRLRVVKVLFAVFVSTMFVSVGSIIIYPLLEIATFLKINTSLWGVIIINIFGLHISNIYLVRNYVLSLPKEMDEAASIDGCDFFNTFFYVVLPLLKPIIATIGILTFQGAWNNYLLPMVFTLANPKSSPLVVGIIAMRGTGQGATSWNLMLAGTVMSMIPMIAIYLIFNRFFISGLSSGAVKG